MSGAARTQITVAVIGLIGVLGAALIANWAGIFGKKSDASTVEHSTTCKFTGGQRAGTTYHFQPGTVIPAPVGAPCQDGTGSYGIAVKD